MSRAWFLWGYTLVVASVVGIGMDVALLGSGGPTLLFIVFFVLFAFFAVAALMALREEGWWR